jgi:hypothetical protein
MREVRNAYKILVRKPKGKRPLKRLRGTCDDGIRMDARKIEWENVVWIRVAEDTD